MKPETWPRIHELLSAARQLSPGEREAWARAAPGEERLRSDVLAMLRAHEDDPWLLGQPAVPRPTPPASQPTLPVSQPAPPAPRPTPPASRPTPPPWRPAPPARFAELSAGALFASCRIVREIGRGAMGVVYEAVQEGQGPRQRIALRLLPRDQSAPALADRFRSVRDLLAHLNHPGLARVLGGGTADDGTPYIAMEYVAGKSLDAWLRDRDPGLRKRVTLVLAVCEALEHAHRHLILHQDLNPSSILVTSDGHVKLLNCGIATLLSAAPGTGDDRTLAGPPLFTPQYASPEQVRGEPVTTATDVYAIGVLLYVVLTGHPPYELGGLSPKQSQHTICHADPEFPSLVVPAPQRRMLVEDLDSIVLKALRKDPRERYPSMTALAADLRAWLDSRPVSASPGTWRYRAARLVRRHRVASAAASVIVLALAGGVLVAAWQAHVTRLGRDRAEAGLRHVLRLSGSSLSDLHDSIRKLPGSAAARRLLLARAAEALDALAKDAGDNRALGVELAEGYRSLGQLQESSAIESPDSRAAALNSFDRAVAFGEQALTAEPTSVDSAILLIGAYGDLAAARLETGERAAADRATARLRSLVEQVARDHPLDIRARAAVASGYNRLGAYRGASEDRGAAKVEYEKAIAGFERLAGDGTLSDGARREHSQALRGLGAVLAQERALHDAQRRYAAALAVDKENAARRPQDGEISGDTAASLSGLALIAREQGDLAAAYSLWAQALTLREAVLKADPNDILALGGVADVQMSLADVSRLQRRLDDSVARSRESLRARERVAGLDGGSPASSAALSLARAYLARALLDLAEARPTGAGYLREAGALLAQAGLVASRAATLSTAQQEALAEVDRQTARLRRLTAQRG